MLRQAQRDIPRILAHLAHQNSPTWPCHGWGLPALYCFWATWYPFPNINRILFNLFIHTGLPADILEHYSLVKSNSARSISSLATHQSLTPLRLYQSESCFISWPLTVSSNRVDLASFKSYPLFSTQTHLIFSPWFAGFPPTSPFILDFSERIRRNKMSFLSTVTFSYIHHEDIYKSCQCWDPVWIYPITNSSLASVTNNSWFYLKAVQDRLNY